MVVMMVMVADVDHVQTMGLPRGHDEAVRSLHCQQPPQAQCDQRGALLRRLDLPQQALPTEVRGLVCWLIKVDYGWLVD